MRFCAINFATAYNVDSLFYIVNESRYRYHGILLNTDRTLNFQYCNSIIYNLIIVRKFLNLIESWNFALLKEMRVFVLATYAGA